MEDCKSLADLVAEGLSDQGIAADVAYDGTEAASKLSVNAYDVVLSAEQLLETVWDENADPFTKTVAVTIGRLRHKLGEPQVIETAVGVGYRVLG